MFIKPITLVFKDNGDGSITMTKEEFERYFNLLGEAAYEQGVHDILIAKKYHYRPKEILNAPYYNITCSSANNSSSDYWFTNVHTISKEVANYKDFD